MARYLARRNMGLLRGVEEKVDRAHRVNDPARPGGGFSPGQRGRAFAAERRRYLTAELRVLVIQVVFAEGICQLGDFVEPRLQLFGNILRRTMFGHRSLLLPISSGGFSCACSWPFRAVVAFRGTAEPARSVRRAKGYAVQHPWLFQRCRLPSTH